MRFMLSCLADPASLSMVFCEGQVRASLEGVWSGHLAMTGVYEVNVFLFSRDTLQLELLERESWSVMSEDCGTGSTSLIYWVTN